MPKVVPSISYIISGLVAELLETNSMRNEREQIGKLRIDSANFEANLPIKIRIGPPNEHQAHLDQTTFS